MTTWPSTRYPACRHGGLNISTLIRNTRPHGHPQLTDVRISGGVIAELGEGLATEGHRTVIDARGATLLPGLHDHHIHLAALAASLDSVHCGPPEITCAGDLAALLAAHNGADGWLRGVGYHPSVAGDIDRHWLDGIIAHRPVRIQHRGGRLWVLNSAALTALGIPGDNLPPGVETVDGNPTGRLYECDTWLRERLGGHFPDLSRASRLLAGFGITGVTDTTPGNGPEAWQHIHQAQQRGELRQRVRLMGGHSLEGCQDTELLTCGEFKIHLLESQLPDLEQLEADIAAAHHAGRAVAIHCVTRTELAFALGALRTAGTITGDRIEHASVAPPELADLVAELGLRVVTQPHFIAERGDQYLAEVDGEDQPWLYRCAGLLAAGIPLAAGSDAPFGGADPWLAMAAAVARKSRAGTMIGRDEALPPEQALALYLFDPAAPGATLRRITSGAIADLCLLDAPWEEARNHLDSRHVRCVWRGGELIFAR